MRVKNKELTVRASIKIYFFKIIEGKEPVGGAAIIRGNDSLFPTQYIVIEPQTLSL